MGWKSHVHLQGPIGVVRDGQGHAVSAVINGDLSLECDDETPPQPEEMMKTIAQSLAMDQLRKTVAPTLQPTDLLEPTDKIKSSLADALAMEEGLTGLYVEIDQLDFVVSDADRDRILGREPPPPAPPAPHHHHHHKPPVPVDEAPEGLGVVHHVAAPVERKVPPPAEPRITVGAIDLDHRAEWAGQPSLRFDIYDIVVAGMKGRTIHFGFNIRQNDVWLQWLGSPQEAVAFDDTHWNGLARSYFYPHSFLRSKGNPKLPYEGWFYVVDTETGTELFAKEALFRLA